VVVCPGHYHRASWSMSDVSLWMVRGCEDEETDEHAAAAWKSVKRTPPLSASLSMFGVRISPPKQPTSENPRSSATMTRKLGRLEVMMGRGERSGRGEGEMDREK